MQHLVTANRVQLDAYSWQYWSHKEASYYSIRGAAAETNGISIPIPVKVETILGSCFASKLRGIVSCEQSQRCKHCHT